MPSASRKQKHVARANLEREPVHAAYPHLCAAARHAHHFMNSRMIVEVIVNAATPALAPAIAFEHILQHCRRIKRAWQTNRPPHHQDRPTRMIGNRAVIFEVKRTRFRNPDK